MDATGELNCRNLAGFAATDCGAFVAFENVIVTMSPTDSPGTTGGGFDATAEAIPGQQTEAPGLLFSLDAQAMHADGDCCPGTALYVPAGHAVQLLRNDEPRAELNVPGGHVVRVPLIQNPPGEHAAAVDTIEPAGHRNPSAHRPVQADVASACDAPNVPSGHDAATPDTQ